MNQLSSVSSNAKTCFRNDFVDDSNFSCSFQAWRGALNLNNAAIDLCSRRSREGVSSSSSSYPAKVLFREAVHLMKMACASSKTSERQEQDGLDVSSRLLRASRLYISSVQEQQRQQQQQRQQSVLFTSSLPQSRIQVNILYSSSPFFQQDQEPDQEQAISFIRLDATNDSDNDYSKHNMEIHSAVILYNFAMAHLLQQQQQGEEEQQGHKTWHHAIQTLLHKAHTLLQSITFLTTTGAAAKDITASMSSSSLSCWYLLDDIHFTGAMCHALVLQVLMQLYIAQGRVQDFYAVAQALQFLDHRLSSIRAIFVAKFPAIAASAA